MASAGKLEAVVRAAATSPRRAVVIDLRRLTFADATGLHAVARSCEHVRSAGGRVGVVAPAPPVDRVIRVTGAQQRLPIVPSLADAPCLLRTADEARARPAARVPDRARGRRARRSRS